MTNKKFEPYKVTKPIQLLATWLLGLIVIESLFLYTAKEITNPTWGASALLLSAIAFVPLFTYVYIHLQTKYRIEMQEDIYFSKYILGTLSKEDIEEKHIEEIEEEFSEPAIEEKNKTKLISNSSYYENYDIFVNKSINFEKEVLEALYSCNFPFKIDKIDTNILLRKNERNFLIDAIIESNKILYLIEIKASKSRRVATRAANQIAVYVEAYKNYAKLNNIKFSIKPLIILPHDIERVGNVIYGIPVLKYNKGNRSFTNIDKFNTFIN